MKWLEMSINKFKNRKTEYCEEVVEVIDLCSWECLRELELRNSRMSVEDVYNGMWDEE
jgi:hypothetical protein